MTSNRNSMSPARAELSFDKSRFTSPLPSVTPQLSPGRAGTKPQELRTGRFVFDGAFSQNSPSAFSAKSAVNPLQLVPDNSTSFHLIPLGSSYLEPVIFDKQLTASRLGGKVYIPAQPVEIFPSTAPSSVASVQTFERLPGRIHTSSLIIHNFLVPFG
jgi:hypothetical protein